MDDLVAQVDQLKAALAIASNEDKAGLEYMILDLEQLIGISGAQGEDTSVSGIGSVPDQVDDEFRLFQEEIAALEVGTSSGQIVDQTSENSTGIGESSDGKIPATGQPEVEPPDVSEELTALVGMKCRAPHESKWQQIGYYNAIVLDVGHGECDSLDNILVRVVFSQPVTESMRPCPFYLEGRCKFEEGGCRYSHGELVSLADLKEYVEPDFSKIQVKSKVLAKYTDELWYEATVQEVTDDGECRLKYNSYNEVATVPLHDTFPLYGDHVSNSSSSSDDSESECESVASNSDSDSIRPVGDAFLLQMRATTSMGDWEKHTKGIGSKLMVKMGYVLGTGLGRHGEGRVDPIDAVVLPPGRSLDACMELKERFGTENMFSAEKRMKRLERKEAQKAKSEEARQKRHESVFNFLNSKLGNHSNVQLSKNRSQIKQSELVKDTNKNLGARMLKVGESIKSVTKEIEKLKEGIKRHEGRDQPTVDRMKSKLQHMEGELQDLKRSESSITGEQKSRNDKKRLSVF